MDLRFLPLKYKDIIQENLFCGSVLYVICVHTKDILLYVRTYDVKPGRPACPE